MPASTDHGAPIPRPALPEVANVHIRSLVSRTTGETLAALDYLDADSRTIARAVVDLEVVERHAHDLLALVASVRAAGSLPDNVIPLRAITAMRAAPGAAA